MIRFIKTTFRSFAKDKLFTGINILGLSLGTACALLLSMIARHDLRFDTFHQDRENIYRVNIETQRGDDTNYHPTCPGPTGPTLVDAYSEVASYVRISGLNGIQVEIEDDLFTEESGAAIVDAAFLEMFNFPLLAGNSEALNEPNQVIINEQLAIKYFGNVPLDQIIGRQLTVDGNINANVAAVMKDYPSHTDLPFTLLISEKSYDPNELGVQVWGRLDLSQSTFVKLVPGTDIISLENKFPDLLTEHAGERMAQFLKMTLQPLSTIHFDERYGNYNQRTTPSHILWGLFVIAAILLITACINFINLSTANAIKRAKEVGIRKVLGVSRKELIGKFFGETSLITFMSLLLAVPTTLLLKPSVEELIGFQFELALNDSFIWLAILGIGVVVVLISGIYPALFMSRFTPAQTLKSSTNQSKGGGAILRRALVVLQFVISQTLLIGLFVIQSQLSYFINADMGFQKDGVITAYLPEGQIEKGKALKNKLANISLIESISLSNGGASSENIWMNGFSFEGAAPDAHHIAEMKMADPDFLAFYDFKLLAGRNYFERDSIPEIVVNRAMIKEMGFSDPEEAIGQGVYFGPREEGQNTIVGVIEDFYTSSLYSEIGPTALMVNEETYGTINLKINLANLTEGIEQAKIVWSEVFPNNDFNYMFLEDQIRQYYEREQQLSSIIMWFTIVALFIGGMGLYGLVTYVVNQRMKELGIRKVMGANFTQLFGVISKEFGYLLAGAFLLAGPMAWYFGNEWLSGYDNRIEIGPTVFLVALMSSIFVAFVAILHKSVIAMKVNPVDTLRNE